MSKAHKDKLWLLKDFLESKVECLTNDDGYVWREEVMNALAYEEGMYTFAIQLIEELIKE